MKYLPYLILPSLMLYGVKLNFSPIYPILIFIIILYIIIILYGYKILLSDDVKVALIFLIFVLIFKFSYEGSFINLALGISVYIILRTTRKYNNIHSLLKLINFTLVLDLIILTLDTYYRFNNPITSQEQIDSYVQSNSEFYIYKFNSLIFADSNAVGIASLSLNMLALYLYEITRIKRYFYFNLFYMGLTLLTFSRSAILATAIMSMYLIIRNKNKIARYLFYVLNVLLLVVGFKYLISDDSFISKLGLYKILLTDYMGSMNIYQKILGLNFGGFGILYTIDAHSIFIKYIYELGLVGTLLICLLIFTIWKISINSIIYVILPIIIAGSSYYIYAGTPFIYAILAIIINFDIYKKIDDEKNIKYYNT